MLYVNYIPIKLEKLSSYVIYVYIYIYMYMYKTKSHITYACASL